VLEIKKVFPKPSIPQLIAGGYERGMTKGGPEPGVQERHRKLEQSNEEREKEKISWAPHHWWH